VTATGFRTFTETNSQGQLSNLDQAAAEFRQALRLNPRFASAHRLLGVTLRRQGSHAGALAQFRRAVEIDAKDPEAQCDLGMELKTGGAMAGAIAAFQRAIALKPDFEKAHYNLGIALRAQGQADAGKKELDQLNPLHDFRANLAQAKLLILRGVEALKNQKLDDALALFQKAVDQSPELPTSYYYLGVAYERKDDPERAIAAYQKALELKPDYSQVQSSLGLLYWRQDDHQRALEELHRAVMADPDLPEGHYNFGLALAQSGRGNEAARELNEAVSLDPKYTDARVQLGLVLGQNNDAAGAASVFRELVRRDPNFAEAHNNLGLVLLQAGDLSAADSEFERRCGSSRFMPKRITTSRWPCTNKERRRSHARNSKLTKLRRSLETRFALKKCYLQRISYYFSSYRWWSLSGRLAESPLLWLATHHGRRDK
jgi:superkiller protein 3